MNRYTYAGNSPCLYTDPTGHCAGTLENHDPAEDECWRAYQEAIGTLGNDYGFLSNWMLPQLNSLLAGLRAGIQFAASWNSPELLSVVGIIKDYMDAFGQERFAEMIRRGVLGQTSGTSRNLVLERIRTSGDPPAGWYDTEGRIKFFDEAFDPNKMAGYHWGLGVPPEAWMYAHEIGHVVLDGLKFEDPAQNSLLQDRYAGAVGQRPHPGFHVNESLTTEVALVALRVDRPQHVEEFWHKYLAPAVSGQNNTGVR